MSIDFSGWPPEKLVTLHRRVKWGECDPAGVVYTPRFADYAAESFHTFLALALQGPLQKKLPELDLATPAKALQFVFHRSLWPDQEFVIHVHAGEIRSRSFDIHFEAREPDGALIFNAQLSAICVHHRVRESRTIPQPLRDSLEAYQKRFPLEPAVPLPP